MKPSWNKATRMLCVRLDSLGDVLMCTPALRALRESLPGRTITLLTSPGAAAVQPYIPEVDDVIAYGAPWTKASGPHAPNVDLAFAAELGARGFDGAIIFTSYSQSPLPAALLCYLANIPLRVAHCHENPYHLLTHWLADPEPDQVIRHEVRRQLDLAAHIGCQPSSTRMSFAVRPTDLDVVRGRLSRLGIGEPQPWIALHPGASAASRRYPPSHWMEVIRQLDARLGCPMVLTGSADEQTLIDQIHEGCGVPVRSLAGQLGLGELGAVLQLATVVVSNNTGPAHIAAAVGTPLVSLYAMTNPQHTPWHVRNRLLYHDVPCRFCMKSICPQGHNECLEKIAPERVVDAVYELLQK
ncbi:lipopolysaccharide heptosyltransferase II [Massilia terrae]|uniref:lipopolysaccharide heptosyltransferase II n=1 Tax=Massilia terrae TaxID=1811224 RepID=A0ABT2CVB0_9BURK|nr:lipopolysaccharide heptosyltransferase II [Massilia terrae]MCS0657911.1 lipopolysaccharide heptosyltransferase II [Massilia terrae]